MVKGRLASYAKGSGDSGAVAYVGVVDRTIIGAGATKRLTLGMTTPYYGENIKNSESALRPRTHSLQRHAPPSPASGEH